MNALLHIEAVLFMMLPTAIHLYNDKNGEKPEEKKQDIILLSLIAVALAVMCYFFARIPIIDSLFLAFAIHFLVFDYAINIILKRRGVIETKESWYTYLGSSYTDDVLRQIHPHVRLIIKLTIFIAGLTVYFYDWH